jgi:hypothetical protein
LDLIHLFPVKKNAVKIIEDKSSYNPEFVKMVLESAARKKRYKVDTNDIWGSLGLK